MDQKFSTAFGNFADRAVSTRFGDRSSLPRRSRLAAPIQLVPKAPVQRSVLNSLQKMRWKYTFASGEIGNGARDLEDATVSSGAQVEFLHRAVEEFATLSIQFAVGLQKAMGHLGVGPAFWFSCEALLLEFARA